MPSPDDIVGPNADDMIANWDATGRPVADAEQVDLVTKLDRVILKVREHGLLAEQVLTPLQEVRDELRRVRNVNRDPIDQRVMARRPVHPDAQLKFPERKRAEHDQPVHREPADLQRSAQDAPPPQDKPAS